MTTLNQPHWIESHPRLLTVAVLLKRARTKAGLVVVLACITDGLLLKEAPFSLFRPNGWVWAGLLLIILGVGFRLAASGCLKKKEVLATSGVYSLCRHPLYLGSMLLTYGFCCLTDDLANWFAASGYFLLFYTTTILWEEVRLGRQYGEAHETYRQQVPLLLPWGHYRRNDFEWKKALRNGGGLLIGLTLVLLIGVEAMARMMRP